MGFFSDRRAQKAAEERQRLEDASSRKLVGPLEQEFKDTFLTWLDRLEDVHIQLNGPPLSNDTLAKAGEMPVPKTHDLVRHHAVEVNAFARSFAGTAVNRRGSEAETPGNSQFYGYVDSFVRSVL